ncbi:general stress protein [Erwinia sp. CGal63]|uniref:general stress protein n=1 Tax=Erwinia sp. CGal63 TaxID=2919889 RepID=UPI003009AE6A
MTQHRGNSGNFAEDREKASEAGKKGGQSSSSGSFKNDREKASESGKKGGQSSRRS